MTSEQRPEGDRQQATGTPRMRVLQAEGGTSGSESAGDAERSWEGTLKSAGCEPEPNFFKE